MRVLTRYLIREFSKILALCLVIFISIYLIVDFIQKVDNFMEAHAPKGAMVAYFIYKTPYIAVQMVPVAALIAVIVLFSLMKKANEITALKASGISVTRLSLSVLGASLVLAVAAFLFSELVVPYSSSRSQDIWNKDVRKLTQSRIYSRDHIWFRGHNAIYWIPHFDGKRMVMEDPVFYFFDHSFRLIRRIEGRRAVWTGETWRLEKGLSQELQEGGTYDSTRFKVMDLELPEGPDTFLKPLKKPEEMSYWQLKRFSEKIQGEGYDATRYLVDMNIKLAFPLVNLIMILIGIPIALGLKKGGTPLAVCLGIGVCFLYLLTLGITRSLGLSGLLPPFLSAWSANGVFLLVGIYLLMHLET